MHRREKYFGRLAWIRGVAGVFLLGGILQLAAAEFEDAEKLFLAGKYEECLQACESPDTVRNEDWELLHARVLLTLGRYPAAEATVNRALLRNQYSIRMRVLGVETARFSGQTNRARARLDEINELVGNRPWAYRNGPDIVALGQAALMLGADPKIVLERFFGTAKQADPELRDVYLASGELALSKNDYDIAAKTFSEALRKFPTDPDILCGLARAYEPNARGRMIELLETALERNQNHVPSLLLLVDHLIDAEEYAEAEKFLDRAFKVNPWHPQAWANRAVLAHLRNDPDAETEARHQALKFWSTNPAVDHHIGKKLSRKYRFAEGAAYQRRALELDPDFLRARIQLAEDLLRLGEENEGWQLAESVYQEDGYNVTAYNLVTLHDTMRTFETLTNADFTLRMSPREAALYGDRAMALLQKAKDKLSEKYGIKLEQPTVVEIFPDQKDFGVRTFGMPHNPGFLGVCFGRVVTANSPASQGGSPDNWEAVLWHEFAHVITLQLTKNKMPRWLSEGISVFEELQENPAWGQRMNPQYREMILNDGLTPIADLSSAFMSAPSDLHMQFAYFESSLVVQFLVERFGFEKLTAILRDLGNGEDINRAIPKHTVAMEKLEKDFAVFAKAKAEALGPGLDWKKPDRARSGFPLAFGDDDVDEGSDEDDTRTKLLRALAPILTNSPASHSETHSTNAIAAVATNAAPRPNYWALMAEARKLVAAEKFEEAKAPLNTVAQLYPDQSGPDNAFALLALVHRSLGETNLERRALENWAALDADALEAYARLMEIAESLQDWSTVAQNARRYLAVNPLVPQPYRFLARAAEKNGDATEAVNAYGKVVLLDPPDPADVHFKLARLLHEKNDPSAKRHLLQALEEAPRYREAHQLLLEMVRLGKAGTNAISEDFPPLNRRNFSEP